MSLTASICHSFPDAACRADRAQVACCSTLSTHAPELCSIELFKAAANIFSHGDGKTYLATVQPDAAGDFTDTITGIINGELLTATATDELWNTSEFAANFSVTLYADVNDNEEAIARLGIYPNPSAGAATLMFYSASDQSADVHILNCLGQEMQSCLNAPCKTGMNTIVLNNDASLPQGLYLVNIEAGNFMKTLKLNIQKN